jgi:cobalt-zinc-cadmium resistance protein CzcA
MVRDAAVEVRKPTLFGELIIMIVYLPILTLEGVEGKLFRPMALTVLFALAGSMVLSMTLMPVLASLLLPRRMTEREPLLMRLAKGLYRPVLDATMKYKAVVLGVTLAVLFVAFVLIAPHLGAEFVPQLSEGAVVVGITRPSGTDLDECLRVNTRIEQALLAAFPDEIRHVWGRVGTPEVATDPMGVEETDLFISLKPRASWTRASTQDELVEQIAKEVRAFPGQKLDLSQPIQQRVEEMTSGVRSNVAVKLFGDDLKILKAKAAEIVAVLEKEVPGSADVKARQVTDQAVLQVKIDQDQIARYGIPAKAVLDLVESVGSKPLGEIVEGPFRFPLVARLPERLRESPEALKSVLLPTPSGERIPLARLARIEDVLGPATIAREWGQRCLIVTANVRGRDVGGSLAEARHKVREKVQLPSARYRVEWGGSFEHYESASRRLFVVVPVAVALIFALLYLTYRNVVDALRVLTGVPLGWVGGIIALWLRGMPFSISAAVGFIALSGVAVLDDMILVSYVRQLRRRGLPRDEAVRQAALTRLRPVLMTTLVASLGFLPMAFSTGMGAEVQRPLATVVIGGVVSAMLMSLLVIRVLYVLFDAAAEWLRGLLVRGFGLRAEGLTWLFGEHGEEGGDETASPMHPGADTRPELAPEDALV